MRKVSSRTILPRWKVIPWWMVLIVLWGTAVWSVQDMEQSLDEDHLVHQEVTGTGDTSILSEEGQLIEQLRERLKALEAREQELQLREERVRALQRDVEALAARQTEEAQRLGRRASTLEEEERRFLAQDPALDQLIKIYEAMDPEEAALRIEEMKEGLALDILAAVKGKKAAALLAGVSPQKAARLSEGLRRHREARLQRQATTKAAK